MYFTFLQQVHLADNTSLDNLPMNTFFSGLLDLGESSESGIDSEFGKKLNPTSGMMGGLRMKNLATPVKRPPLRQPFVNGQVVVGVDAEKKMSQDMVNFSPSLQILRTSNNVQNYWCCFLNFIFLLPF